MSAGTVIEGTVTKVSGQVAERPGEWLNVSKFAKPGEADIPAVGERVSITLDKAGFIRKVELVETAPHIEPTTASVVQVGDKDKLIVRQSSLKAAVYDIALSSRQAAYCLQGLAALDRLVGWLGIGRPY